MIRYFIPFAINTHIDCLNNSKCSVRCIFKATARSLESVTLSISVNNFQFDPTFDEFDGHTNKSFILHPKYHQFIANW